LLWCIFCKKKNAILQSKQTSTTILSAVARSALPSALLMSRYLLQKPGQDLCGGIKVPGTAEQGSVATTWGQQPGSVWSDIETMVNAKMGT